MAEAKRVRGKSRKCRHCTKKFVARSGRQVYCKRDECTRDRKYKYWKKYIEGWKKRNPEYWATYLKKWRRDHPNYFKEWRRKNPNYFKEWYKENKDRLKRRRAAKKRTG